jgi:hypothetical protein
MRVGTHVTTALVARLPVPRPSSNDENRREIARLSREMAGGVTPQHEARLNAAVARLYGLSPAQFRRVLDTFPLVPAAERDATLAAFVGANGR